MPNIQKIDAAESSAVCIGRHKAFALMSEALAILDAASADTLVAARLQMAIDAFETIDLRDWSETVPMSPAVATQLVDGLLSTTGGCLHDAIDALPVPAYVTDADGLVAYWNQHCVAFAGCQPELGKDRWCVTWKLHTKTGEQLPHDQCPMAVAIREQRAVRGEVAIAERPDGQRVAFTPYPTLLFDNTGQLTCAVNILIDVSKTHREELRTQAEYCRRIADAVGDRRTQTILSEMADGYEQCAASLHM